jgi:fermentation-respiration switch protein FrsA (DUF1100 family)
MTRRRKLTKTLIAVLLTCLLIVLMLRWFEHSQVYHPSRVLTATGAELGRPFEDVRFKASDGVELNGWFFAAATNSPRARVRGAAVPRQRVATSAIGSTPMRAMLATGVNVFAFDYRGYGLSEGRPSEEGTYRDAQAAYQWLRQEGFPGTNIIAFGESLGGGVAAELAARETVGGLVLQSTFTSVTDMGAELFPWLPVRWLGTIHYDTRSKLPHLKVPVLVMHSPADGLVRFHHGQTNFAAANEPKLFWELKGDHNDPLADTPALYRGPGEVFQPAQRSLILAGKTG